MVWVWLFFNMERFMMLIFIVVFSLVRVMLWLMRSLLRW